MAVQALQAYVSELQKRIDDNDYEPQFDDKDEKKDKELRYVALCMPEYRTQHARTLTAPCCHRESEDLSHGAVLKGTVEQGAGNRHPQEGDLVG